MNEQIAVTPPTEAPIVSEALNNGSDAPVNLDAELSAIFDRNHVTNGADRDDNGKFTSPDPEKAEAVTETPSEVDASATEATGQGEETATETAVAEAVPLPSSWRDKSDDWSKLPDTTKQWIAEHENATQRTLSEQGRTISTLKPVQDVIKANEHLFTGRTKPDGSRVSPHEAIAFLFDAQAKLDQNPVQALIGIARSYGAEQGLAQALGVQGSKAPPDTQVLLNEIAGLKRSLAQNSPQNLQQMISQTIEERTTIDGNARLFNDFAEKNPLVKEVPTDDLLQFIEIAKTKLSDTATPQAVLERAYDMAVHADPTLRAKTAAAKPAVPLVDAKKAEEAKRANSVNVKSTSTGKPRLPSLDEELDAIWEKNRKA